MTKVRALERFIRRFPQRAGALAIAIGAIVLAGWLAGVGWMTRLAPGRPVVMVANTAIMCMLAGAALWAVWREPIARTSRRFAQICALAVCAIAGLTGLEYATGIDLGIDQLLPHAPGPFPAGRPAPQTACAFLALGSGLLLIDRSIRGRHPSDYLALAAIVIAMGALLGYMFGAPTLYEVAPSAGLSVPTAVVVLALGCGLIAVRIERSVLAVVLARDAGGFAARWLFGGLLLLPPVALVLLAGAHAGWYTDSFASALVLLLAIVEASALILSTAKRLGRADAALHASEGRVRVLLDQASDAIFVADLQGHYTEVNDAACRLLGYSRAEILGKTILDLIPREDVPRLAAARERLAAGGVEVSEWRLRRRDGTYLPVEVSAKIFADGRWQGIARDITERMHAEAALRRAAETERALRAEIETLMGAVAKAVAELPRSDVDAVLRAVADQARALTGARYAAAAIGAEPLRAFDRWAVLGMPDDALAKIGRPPRAVGLLGHALKTGEALRVPDVARHPEFQGLPPGHPPLGNFLAVPIKHRGRLLGALYLANKSGAPEFSEHDARVVTALAERVAVAIETATLHETEARLRAWLQSIIDQLPEGVIVLDETAQVKAMNRAMRALARPDARGPDPIGNFEIPDVREPDQRPVPFEDRPGVLALRRGETIRDRELLLRQADGRMLPVAATAAPVRDDRQRITGATVIVTDISERKELERMREEWIAVVAHDLRQPLNTILLWTERLASLATDDKQRSGVERVRSAGWRLNRMIEDLLDAARLAANQLSVDPRATDVVGLARTAIENARLASPSAEIRLTAAERELAWADGDRVLQVLGNLISNAVKYGAPGAPIRVEIAGRDGAVELTVENEGPELSADALARLFARFSRSQQARTARIPGIGLGLYICKGLVEAHGGRIWAESARGTTAFRFTLPRPPE
jgi:PAS domain S-box-containing protein